MVISVCERGCWNAVDSRAQLHACRWSVCCSSERAQAIARGGAQQIRPVRAPLVRVQALRRRSQGIQSEARERGEGGRKKFILARMIPQAIFASNAICRPAPETQRAAQFVIQIDPQLSSVLGVITSARRQTKRAHAGPRERNLAVGDAQTEASGSERWKQNTRMECARAQ